MDNREKQVGRKIARLRKAAGLTQAALAELVGVQPETIGRVEIGRRAASLGLIGRVSDALQLEFHELFRLRDPPSPRDEAVEHMQDLMSRLSAPEIDLVAAVGKLVVDHARRVRSR